MKHKVSVRNRLEICKQLLLYIFFSSLLAAHDARAINLDSDENLRVSGFGTIGLVRSSNDELGYRQNVFNEAYFGGEWEHKPHMLLGLQLDAKISDKLDATVQVVAKDRPNNSLKNSLQWAFLRYQVNSDLTIRAGRMGSDIYMLSAYNNVGFAYLWAQPPMEFYGPLGLEHFDGFDVNYVTRFPDGDLHFKLFFGLSKQDSASEAGDFTLELDPIFGANLTWESEHWIHRAGFTRSRFAGPIESLAPMVDPLSTIPPFLWPDAAALADEFDATGRFMNYFSLGTNYDEGLWDVQGEVGYIDSDYQAILPDTLTAYLSVGYRVDPVTIYGIAAMVKNTEDTLDVPAEPSGGTDPLLVALEQAAQLVSERTGIDQHSLKVGLRWDLSPNIALKLQWDRIWIDEFGGGLWVQPAAVDQDRTVNMYHINLNFWF